MKRILYAMCIYIMIIGETLAGTFIDTVYSFTPGTVQFNGQSPEYFPANIFGPPASIATWKIPASSPEDLCSIGMGGEIIVGLKNGRILNGEGPDFIIFENAFEREFDGVIFAEPAIVSVSQNGVDFIEFPYDEWTLSGLAGKTPTNGNANPFDYTVSGGDAFDLEDLGLDYITHIKIKDVSHIVSVDASHPYYQPSFMMSGFDLDAIALIYPDYLNSSICEENSSIVFSDNGKELSIFCPTYSNISIYNVVGELVLSTVAEGSLIIEKSNFPKSLYIVIISSNNQLKRYTFVN